jgi:hypothetical protein
VTVSDPESYDTGGPGVAYGPCWSVGILSGSGSYSVS